MKSIRVRVTRVQIYEIHDVEDDDRDDIEDCMVSTFNDEQDVQTETSDGKFEITPREFEQLRVEEIDPE